MAEFKKGDYVRCINTSGLGGRLKAKTRYRVANCGLDWVALEGHQGTVLAWRLEHTSPPLDTTAYDEAMEAQDALARVSEG